VIGGRCGGITLQIEEGVNGYLVDDVETAAKRAVELLRDPQRANEMGAAGREHVRRNFVSTRELEDWLGLFSELR
jgi:trehalose synthase